MMKTLILGFFSIFFLSNSLLSQSSYIMVNGNLDYDVVVKKASEKELCKGVNVIKDGISKYYSPNEIDQFGFKDGDIYLANEVEINGNIEQVFLKKIITGNLSLYYFYGEEFRYYFKVNDSLNRLNIDSKGRIDKKDIDFLILQNKSCDKVKPKLFDVKVTKLSVNHIFSVLNDCKIANPNSFKFAVFGGVLNTIIETGSEDNLAYLKRAEFENKINPTYGLKFEYGNQKIAITSELFYNSVDFHSFKADEIFSSEVFLFQDYLNHSLALKFSTRGARLILYSEFGIQTSYALNKEISTHISSETYDKVIYRKIDKDPIVSRYQGYTLAKVGVAYRILPNLAFYTEFRYSDLINETSGDAIVNLKNIGPVIGLTMSKK